MANSEETPRVTLREVARIAGVNVSTASRALHRDVRISQATQARVASTAAKIGYRPDPLLSRFAAQRWKSGNPQGHPNLVMIDFFAQKTGGRLEMKEGAMIQAKKLGYNLDFLTPRDFKSAKQLGRLLKARGIQGVVLIGSDPAIVPFLDWNKFSIVQIGFENESPFHTVYYDVFAMMRWLWNAVRKRGYRRIGASMLFHNPLIADDDLRLAAIEWMRHQEGGRDVPPHLYSLGYNVWDEIPKWAKRWKPDAIIGFNGSEVQALQAAGIQIPKDIGFVCTITDKTAWVSGVEWSYPQITTLSVDVLDSLIRNNERGVPRFKLGHLISPVWIEGKTLPSR
jgi:LacI family transcriptional regulator